MAAKVTAPNPGIFTSDPLEQIFARGVMDRDMSGLAYMFLNAAGDRRASDQDSYMRGLGESNQVAKQVAEQELRQKQQEEFLKAAVKLTEMGSLPSSMPVLDNIFQGAANRDDAAKLAQDLIRSKIAANNANAAGGKGDGLQVTTDIGPGGTGFTTIRGKGANAQQLVDQAVIQQLKLNAAKQAASPTEADKMKAARERYGNVPQ